MKQVVHIPISFWGKCGVISDWTQAKCSSEVMPVRNWDWKQKILFATGLSLLVFLTYLFFRVRMASGLPVVHTLWNLELASLLRTTAKSVQLLGLIAGGTVLCSAFKNWRAKKPFIYVQFLQAVVLCSVSFVAPDLASNAIPILFGLDF